LKLVVDTNVILKALIRDSTVRALLLNPERDLCVPEYTFEELEKHMNTIVEKSGLFREEIQKVLSTLLTKILVLPAKEIAEEWERAEAVIGWVDPKDVPFVAAALSVHADGIWSDNKDLKRQKEVRVWNTAEIKRVLH